VEWHEDEKIYIEREISEVNRDLKRNKKNAYFCNKGMMDSAIEHAYW
jgi:hypothetical protein